MVFDNVVKNCYSGSGHFTLIQISETKKRQKQSLVTKKQKAGILFSPFWAIIWPFWSISNLMLYKNTILSPFGLIPVSLADFPIKGGRGQSVTSCLETSRSRDFSQFFERIGLGLENFGLEKKSRYRFRQYLV